MTFAVMAVARWKEIWVGMVVANFRVLEGADSLELDICVFVEYFVAIFPDIVCVISECSDGTVPVLSQVGPAGLAATNVAELGQFFDNLPRGAEASYAELAS